MAKSANPAALVKQHRIAFGSESAMLMGETGTGVASVCPTGMAVVDRWVLGVGGLPYGRIIEVSGAESSGKTTIMNKLLAGVQADGGVACLVETEQSYDPLWARLHGVDIDNLMLMQPDHLDGKCGALEQFEALIENSSGPILIALDSVAAAQSKREFDEGLTGDAGMAELARAWSQGLRRLNPIIARRQAILVLVNQTRAVIGQMYGPKSATTGGNAIKFYASIRLQVSHGPKVDNGAGRLMSVMGIKNKCSVPYRKAMLKMSFTEGFNDRWSILNHAKDRKVVGNKAKSYNEALLALGWDIQGSDLAHEDAIEIDEVEVVNNEEESTSTDK